MIIFINIIAIALTGCMSSKQPLQDEIIGTWVSSDGATLQLKKDGNFIGKDLPAEYFSFHIHKEEALNRKINGEGRWRLEKNQGDWEVKLDFEVMNNIKQRGFYSVLVSGSKGILENKSPWYLFLWKEEEGGDRYKFFKKE